MKNLHKNVGAHLFEVETQCLKSFCLHNVTEVTQKVLNIIQRQAWDEYISLDLKPSDYSDADVDLFRIDYQAVSMLKKSRVIPLSVDKRRNALDKFEWAEAQCKETNERLIKWAHNPNDNPECIDVVAKAQHIIWQILGPVDEDALEFVSTHCRFGPGSTRSIGSRPTAGRKFDNPRPMATPRLAEFLVKGALLPTLWKDRLVKVELRASSKITTVPKNAKTDRTIAIEPDLNIYVQLGVGALIRNRLLQSGLNLAKQADRNAALAAKAHICGLATIDLSSASDCVSRSCVDLLLPEEWRHLLRLARVDYYQLDGEIYPFEKWSSMGNGYTFELETLIFTALARACGDRFAVSYGDDIIVKSEVTPLLLRTLNFLGFSVNEEKTFTTGLFFESCGTDWFNGINVRPFFLRGDPEKITAGVLENQPSTDLKNDNLSKNLSFCAIMFQYANSISTVAHRSADGLCRDRRYFSSWRTAYHAVHPTNRLRIPVGFNTSGGFESDWDESNKATLSVSSFSYLRWIPARGKVNGDWGPYLAWHNNVMSTPSQDTRSDIHDYAVRLARTNVSSESYARDGEPFRNEGSLKIEIGSCFAWPNRGPWC